MVDWTSSEVIAEDALAFMKFIHVLLAIYTWEWLVSLDFEWQYLSRKKAFRWPLIFYFLNRYCLLFSLIGIITALDATGKINCQVLYSFSQVLGTMTMGFVSINLSIRTMAVWNQQWYIVTFLIIMIIGHWALLMHGGILKSSWDLHTGCVISDTYPKVLSASFFYTTCFDFIVLSLAWGRLRWSSTEGSRIGSLLCMDGLVYFVVVFISNLVTVTFIMLNLNPVMSIIGTVPSAVVSTIVTCRAIRRLANYSLSEMQLTTFQITTFATVDQLPTSVEHPTFKPGNVRIQTSD